MSICSDGRLWFGKKYRGQALADVPGGYLRFMLGLPDLDAWLAVQVKAELNRRGERIVPAAQVLADVEDQMAQRIGEDDAIDHATAARVGDHLLEAMEAVRAEHSIGDSTNMLIPARREPRPDGWRDGEV